jgi:hypothetical protein
MGKKTQPKRKRFRKPARLASAQNWLPAQAGRTARQIAASYRKRYGVDWQAAILELQTLGLTFDEGWLIQIRKTLENAQRARAAANEARKQKAALQDLADSDENFAFIAGYTPGGFPYGITWEEAAALEQPECDPKPQDPF